MRWVIHQIYIKVFRWCPLLELVFLIHIEQQGVTAELNAQNQLEWIGLMNNIKAHAEEIIYTEIVYVRGA